MALETSKRAYLVLLKDSRCLRYLVALISAMETQHDQELKSLRDSYQTEVSDLKSQYEEEISVLKQTKVRIVLFACKFFSDQLQINFLPHSYWIQEFYLDRCNSFVNFRVDVKIVFF